MAGKQPDVRVRLSAEGVQEVVNAFKRVQAEGEKLGKSGSLAGRGLSFLTGQVGSLARALPALTVGAAVAGFVAMTKRSLELADSLGKLEQKTGISVETLSTLSFAARTADVDQEQLRVGLVKFTRTVDDYDQGVKSARNATLQLFGNRDALEGLTDDQRLLKVVDALAKLEPGAKRTGLAIEFFGKAGAELLPLIDDLGNGGFDELRKKAERLGLVIDSDLARAAQEANDAMTDLKSTAEGITLQFAAGFAPALADVGDALVEATTQDGVNGFRVLGEFAGLALKGIILLVSTLVLSVINAAGRIKAFATNSYNFLRSVFSGQGIADSFRQFREDLTAEVDGLDKETQEKLGKIVAALEGANRQSTRRRTRTTDTERSRNLEQGDKLAKARRALQEQLAENELNLLKANSKLLLDEERRRFELGLTFISSYYQRRREIIEAEVQKEIEILERRIEAERQRTLNQGETETDRLKNVATLQAQIGVLQIEHENELAALKAEERKAAQEAAREQLSAEAQLLEAQGQRFAAARKELEAQISALQRLKGETDSDFAARQEALRAAGQARIGFEEAQAQAQAALAQLNEQRQAVIDQVRAGILFQSQGEQQIIAIERERLPILEQIAAALLAAAEATGDPEKITRAREFNQAIRDLAIGSDQAAQRMAELKAASEQAVNSGLTQFFSSGIEQAEGFGDAVRGLALSVVDSLRQMLAQMLANIVTMKIFGSLLKGLGLFSGGGLVQAPGKATGGLIRGPGSSTSDSIPARLSDYEFVVRAAVVKQPGMLEFLNELNRSGASAVRRRSRGFADGGLVEITGSTGPTGRADLTLDLDDTLLLKRLEASPMFARVVVRTAERNKKAMNSALGRGAL